MLDLNNFEKKFKQESWWVKLKDFFATKEAFTLYEFLKKRAKEGHVILPTSDKTFDCFNHCSYNATKVIVLGQEPYPQVFNKIPVADGLSFSCSNSTKEQPSLEYLKHSIRNNFPNIGEMPNDLRYLANQGMIWLNYSLTVEMNKIGSHVSLTSDVYPYKNLWEPFLKYLLDDAMYGNSGVIFILLGKEAQKLKKYINPLGNYILESNHPSYAARNVNTDWDADNVWKTMNNIIHANNGPYFTIEFDYNEYLLKEQAKKEGCLLPF